MDVSLFIKSFFFLWLYSTILGLGRLHETFCFTSVTRSRTVGRTSWMGDQFVARPLPVHKHRKTHTHHIHARGGIQTHDHSVPVSEDSSCFRPLSYRDRPKRYYLNLMRHYKYKLLFFMFYTLFHKIFRNFIIICG
jgi:hypothetical protein